MKINGAYSSEMAKKKEVSHEPHIKSIEKKEVDRLNLKSEHLAVESSALIYKDSPSFSIEKEQEVGKATLEETLDRTSSLDLIELEEKNQKVGELSEKELEENIQRIKKEREAKAQGIEKQKDAMKEQESNIEKLSKGNISDRVQQLLEQFNLPITGDNIEKIELAYELTKSFSQISDQSIGYLIKNKLEITPNNIYTSIYSSKKQESTVNVDQMFFSLEKSVEQVIEKSFGISMEEGKKIGKWLLQNQLPITTENMYAYKNMSNMSGSLDENLILEKIVEGYKNGSSAKDVILFSNHEAHVGEIHSVIDGITLEDIQGTLSTTSSKEISLYDISSYEKLEDEQKLIKYNNQDMDALKVFRQLEELRLKMSIEAGVALLRKGIHVETQSLSKLVDELKEMEDSYYKKLLQQGKVEVNEATVGALKNTLSTIEVAKNSSVNILGKVYKENLPQTITTLYNENLIKNTVSSPSNTSVNAYEQSSTTPNRNYGDSIEKAFSNMDSILESLDLDKTADNQRAVKILGYNSMDINEESIDYIKAFDKKLEYMKNELYPNTTVELIRRGKDPLNMPLDELNQYIDTINQDIGVGSEEKYSKFLWKLEKENGITKGEKEAYIGLYRLLHNVDKTSGAALGSVIKAEKELTLGNLLEAVRTRKLGGIDSIIDDSYGERMGITEASKSITSQIKEGFQGNEGSLSDKISYNQYLVKESKELLLEKNLTFGLSNLETQNMTIEDLYLQLVDQSENKEMELSYQENRKEQLQEIIRDSKGASELLNEIGMEKTLLNIQSSKVFLSKDDSVYHKLNDYNKSYGNVNAITVEDISSELIETFDDSKRLKQGLANLENKINNEVEEALSFVATTIEDDGSRYQQVDAIKSLRNGFHFLSQIEKKERYQVPVQVGETITNMNVTLVHDKGDSGKIDMKIQSEEYGLISIHISVRDKKVNGVIQVENRRAKDSFEQRLGKIKNQLEQVDLSVSNLVVVLRNKGIQNVAATKGNSLSKKETVEDRNEVPSSQSLYKIAKQLLVAMKEIELETLDNSGM